MPSSNQDRPIVLIVARGDSIKSLFESASLNQTRHVAFEDGQQATDWLKANKPDLILIGADGFPASIILNLCRTVRALDSNGAIEILVASSNADFEFRIELYNSGADDFVQLPAPPSLFARKINALLRYRPSNSMGQSQNYWQPISEMPDEAWIHRERLAFLGERVGELVHNVRNPLSIARAQIMLLMSANNSEPRLESSLSAIDRVEETIRSVLAAIRKPKEADRVNLQFDRLLQEEITFLKLDPFFKYQVQLSLDIEAGLPPITASEISLKHSIGNIVRNALQAMRNRTERKLEVKLRRLENHLIASFTDTGSGIPNHLIAHVGTAFFSDNSSAPLERTQGTGLGLSFVRRTLESIGGTMTIQSKVDVGTTVQLSIPYNSAVSSTL